MRAAVVDFQGYLTSNNTYIVKELTVVDVDNPSAIGHWVFKPPPEEGNSNLPTNIWLYHNLIGINWNAGNTEYADLSKLVLDATKTVTILYAKGLEKSIFLEKLIGKEVFNLQNFGCPSLKRLQSMEFTKCTYHCGKKYNCSLKFANALNNWISKNRSKVDLYDAKVREKTFDNWSGSINPELLSFNGFFLARNHTIKCI